MRAQPSPAVRFASDAIRAKASTHLGGPSAPQARAGWATLVVDRDTSELVERKTYLAYGQVDSDYRPDRWQDFREDYSFTGKEDDIEVGLTYFGARYLSSQLGSWISPDPMAIHGLAGDLNPYAYVHGRIVMDVDPTGMDDTAAAVAALAAMAPNTTTLTWWVDPTAPKDGDDPYTPTIGQRILVSAFQVAAAALGDSAVGRSDGARFDENGGGLTVIRPQSSATESYVVSSIHAASLVATPGMKAAVGAALQTGADVVKTAVSRVMLRVTSVAERAPGLAVQTAIQAGGGVGGQVAAGAADGTVGVMSPARAGADLAKQLASQAQLGEMAAGAGRPIAGPGSDTVFRDAARIAQTYGGRAADWAKMTSSGLRAADGTTFATHWVENVVTGQQVEEKVVIDVFGGP